MDLYAENILAHYRAPQNKGELREASITHTETNHSCGDEITVQMNIENGRIADIAWQGAGCAISQAGMSMLSEEVKGMTLEKAGTLGQKDVHNLLGIPVGPRRFKCALLCLHTLKNALNVYRKVPVQGWLKTVEIDEE